MTISSLEPSPNQGRLPRNGDLTSGLPVWARVVAIIGLPGALLSFLIYVGAQSLPGIATGIEEVKAETLRNRTITQESAARSELQQDAIFRMLQRVCSNTAKTEAERDRCFDP